MYFLPNSKNSLIWDLTWLIILITKWLKEPQENHLWILPSQFYQYNREHRKYKNFKKQVDLTDIVWAKTRSLECTKSFYLQPSCILCPSQAQNVNATHVLQTPCFIQNSPVWAYIVSVITFNFKSRLTPASSKEWKAACYTYLSLLGTKHMCLATLREF